MHEISRDSENAYWSVKRLGEICAASDNRTEAIRRVREEFPNEDLTELVQHIAPFRALKE